MNNIMQMISMFRNNPAELISQCKANPMAVISQFYNIPPELQNAKNGQDIVQYLLDSKQTNQYKLNEAMQKSRQPQYRQFMR